MRTRSSFPRPHRASRLAPVLASLGLLLALTGAAPFWSREKGPSPRPKPRGPEVFVSAAWLARHRSDRGVIVLDARSRAAFDAGHVPGARSLPADSLAASPEPAALLARAGLSGTERIVCCGEGGPSPDAARLLWLLEVAGAARARVLDGGMAAWTSAGGTADTRASRHRPSVWKRAADSTRVATRRYLGDRLGEPGYEVFDARTEAEWEGRASEPRSADLPAEDRAGHAPHSLPFDFRSLYRADGTVREPDSIRAILARSGPREATPVNLDAEFILYDDGRSGLAMLGYAALRAAEIDPLRCFAGGWAEWAADSTLPIVRIIDTEKLHARLLRKRRLFAREVPESSFVFFDVRTRADYDAGHLRGAVLLQPGEFADSLDAVVSRYWPGVDRSRVPLVVYCYGPSCIRSRNCATMAARQGFCRLEWYRAGIEGWENAHFEVVPTKPR